jgi:hypothetical protein
LVTSCVVTCLSTEYRYSRSCSKNKKVSGFFLPEERAWLDGFAKSGFIDSLIFWTRKVITTLMEYDFFSKIRNKGWRIDYCLVSESLKQKIKCCTSWSYIQTIVRVSGDRIVTQQWNQFQLKKTKNDKKNFTGIAACSTFNSLFQRKFTFRK